LRTSFWDRVDAGRWEPDTLTAVKLLTGPGTIFFDIGAWVGSLALFAAANGGRVVAYEPDPRTFPYLVKNLELNPTFAGRVELHGKACGCEPGRLTLHTPSMGSSNAGVFSSVERNGEIVLHQHTFDVDVIDVRQAIGSKIANSTDKVVVKIDTEGGEFQFFPALAKYLHEIGGTCILSTHPHYIVRDTPEQSALDRVRAKTTIIEAALPFSWHCVEGNSIVPVDRGKAIAGSFARLN
jgi:FkbM family methyltransferase